MVWSRAHGRGAGWLKRAAACGIAIGLVLGGLVSWRAHSTMSPCEATVRSGDRLHGVAVCLASRAERDRIWTARAYMYAGELDEAGGRARRLLSGPRYAEAHGILSYLALRGGSGSAARMHAAVALIGHALAGDDRGRAVAAIALAQAAWKLGDLTASLDAANEANRLARRLRDPVKEVASLLARGDALRRMGALREAAEALRAATARATQPCDVAWAHAKTGMCWMEAQQASLAMTELAAAEDANRTCGSCDIAMSTSLAEAWILRAKDPAAARARLDHLGCGGGDLLEVALLRGYLAADRGDLAEAERALRHAEQLDAPDADWPWLIAQARAELAELRGGPGDAAAAEAHYRRAIAMVAALRTTARARSAYLVASHRGPYDGLIALLAGQGRWRDALAVILELDASDMLRATADARALHDHAALELPSPSAATAAPAVRVDDVIAAWRGRELAIVLAPLHREIGPDHDRVIRLRIVDGVVTGEAVGDPRAARAWASALFADPADRAAARALGEMIVPPGGEGALHVLAIGALGKVPLAALRDPDGALCLARRPLVRVLGLRAIGPASSGAGPAVILADARADLPGAAVEGELVAAAVAASGPGAGGPAPATRARLWQARDAALLHVAGHVAEVDHVRALRLADGDVGPAEMIEHRLAPRLAVLASCGSAAALDEEGWGSIAAALLASGTRVVIATDRSIDDAAALSVMRRFYSQRDWRRDPAGALARVQVALAAQAGTPAAGAAVWAAFSVLGRPPAVRAE